MSSKSKIKIVSKLSPEFSNDITVDNTSYHVQTEDLGRKSRKIISKIYLKGEVIFSKKTEYTHLTKLSNFKNKLSALMENMHKSTIGTFISEQSKKQNLRSEYFDEIQQLLRRGNGKSAISTLRYALEKFPLDPFFLSYYGCLVAVVENKPKDGIHICIEAINRLDNSIPFGSEFFYPVFYLNLGRAYLKDNKKNEAIKAFHEGLRIEPENHDLLWELKKLGKRKKSPIPFLKRRNPINKYIGKLLSKTTQRGSKK
jgi:tetratricopeptide (TPR) repeat protein